jgi:hypothetical protein
MYVYNFDNEEALEVLKSVRDAHFPELSDEGKKRAYIENSIKIQVAKININKTLK